MKLYYDQDEVRDVDEVVKRLPEKALASPYRSSVPLLSLVRHDPSRFADALAPVLSGNPVEAAHFEYRVRPQKGTGQASHTDAMVKSRDHAVAVEAKWTESRYDTVEKWLKAGSSPENREAVLRGWLSLLGVVDQTPFLGLPYQFVHRAASARSVEGRQPALVYLHFVLMSNPGLTKDSDVKADLRALHAAMGDPPDFPLYVLRVSMRGTERFAQIESLKKGEADTHVAVSSALVGGPLFEFEEAAAERVAG